MTDGSSNTNIRVSESWLENQIFSTKDIEKDYFSFSYSIKSKFT